MDEMMNQAASAAEPTEKELKAEPAKPFSLRLGEDSVQAFRHWCDEQGMSQADGFSALIKMMELQQSKDMIPNRQKEVEDFQALVTAITDAFLRSLTLNENAELRIRQEVQLELQTKDQSIADYQEQLRAEKEKIKAKEEKIKELTPLENQLFVCQLEVKKLEQQLEEQKRYLDIAQQVAADSAEKAKAYDELTEAKQAVDVALSAAESQIKELESEMDKQQELAVARCETAKVETAQAIRTEWQAKLDEKIAALRQEFEKTLATERADHQNQLELQREKLMNKNAGDLEKLHAEIRLLERTNGQLETKISNMAETYNNLQTEYTAYKKQNQ